MSKKDTGGKKSCKPLGWELFIRLLPIVRQYGFGPTAEAMGVPLCTMLRLNPSRPVSEETRDKLEGGICCYEAAGKL